MTQKSLSLPEGHLYKDFLCTSKSKRDFFDEKFLQSMKTEDGVPHNALLYANESISSMSEINTKIPLFE